MTAVIPELGGKGWIADPRSMMEKIFINAMLSDRSQSTIYYDNVTSLPYILNLYQQDPDLLADRLQTALRTIYGRYSSVLDNVVVTVEITENQVDAEDVSTYDVEATITTTVDGVIHNLSAIANEVGSDLETVFRVINT